MNALYLIFRCYKKVCEEVLRLAAVGKWKFEKWKLIKLDLACDATNKREKSQGILNRDKVLSLNSQGLRNWPLLHKLSFINKLGSGFQDSKTPEKAEKHKVYIPELPPLTLAWNKIDSEACPVQCSLKTKKNCIYSNYLLPNAVISFMTLWNNFPFLSFALETFLCGCGLLYS